MKHKTFREKTWSRRLLGTARWAVILFFVCLPFDRVQALGLYTPSIDFGEVVAGEDQSGTFRVVREAEEVGTGRLSVSVEITGDQASRVTGANQFYLAADENAYDYHFIFNPQSASTGDYEIQFVFSLTPSASQGETVGALIRSGVEGNVLYHMTASSSGGGGGTSSSGSSGGGSSPSVSDGGGDDEDDADAEEEEEEEDAETDEDTGTDEEDTEAPDEEESSESAGEEQESEVTESEEGDGSEAEASEPLSEEAVSTTKETLPSPVVIGETQEESTEIDYYQTISDFVASYGQTGGEADTYDFDQDGMVGLSDFSHLVSQWDSQDDIWTGFPPVTAGDPLEEDVVLFKFQVAKADQEKFSVVLSSAKLAFHEEVAMYLLVDTGEQGVNAADLDVLYDTDKLRFIDSGLEGSVFSVFRSIPKETEPGVISVVAVDPNPFVGTDGYVVTLRFALLDHGTTALRFDDIQAFSTDAYEPEEVLGTDLLGVVQLKSQGASTSEQGEEEATTSSLPTTSFYFSYEIDFLTIILLLIMLMDMVACWILYRDTKYL